MIRNRIDDKFDGLRRISAKAFIAYIMAGDPDLKATERTVLKLEKLGVDIVELGIPFSDPLADGPVIQAAAQRALRKKITLKKIFRMVARLRDITDLPIVFMCYYNPILKFGEESFFKRCRDAGVDGLIVPDLPLEEARVTLALGRKYGVCNILLVAPTTSRKRAERIIASSSGFVYYVSLTGVTGVRKNLPPELISNVRSIKLLSDKPVAVGFGISGAKQARRVASIADGAIVGSAIINASSDEKRGSAGLTVLVRKIAGAIHGA